MKLIDGKTTTGIVYDLKRFAVHDGPGIRTTVFLKGCPLSCWWCHNPESQNPEPEPRQNLQHKSHIQLFRHNKNYVGAQVSAGEIIEELKKDRIFFEESGGGVTFSGGEPLMQPEFLAAMVQECKRLDFHVAVDTCGYAPFSVFEKILHDVNLFLYDLKLIDDVLHQKFTGVSNKLTLENLKKLVKTDKNIHIRVPLIPEITDSEQNLDAIVTFLLTLEKELPVDLLPYNKIGESKYARLKRKYQIGEKKTQSSLNLIEIEEKFKSAGIEILPR